ncbi:MAG: hypothetical protein HDS56_08210 [Barnesiella sp.]|nr:hypothetical protein [Barnesiella sp.]
MNHRLALLLIFISILTSCGRHGNDVLNRADDIMEDDPEQALELLTSVDATALSRSDAAYRAMLLTQAQVKCSADIPSDSLINSAIEYYRSARDDDRRLRAYFYKGQLSFCYHDYRESMKYILEAYEMAKELYAPLWIARSAEVLSDINFDVYNYPQAEIFSTEAIKYYNIAKKFRNVNYAICDLATIYSNENRLDTAISLFDSLYNATTHSEPVDSPFLQYMSGIFIRTLIEAHKYDEIKHYNLPVDFETTYEEQIVPNALLQSGLLQEEGDFDKSEDILLSTILLANNSEERAQLYYAQYKQAQAVKDYEKMAQLSDTLLLLQSRIAEELLCESVMSVHRDFYSEKSKSLEQESKYKNIIISLIIFIAVSVISLMIYIYKIKMKHKKAEIESIITDLIEMRNVAEVMKDANNSLQAQLLQEVGNSSILKNELESRDQSELKHIKIIESLFKQKWTTINQLCNEYFEVEDSKILRNVLLSRIEKEIKKLSSAKGLKEIEEAVDKYRGGIMTLLRKECDFFKEDDYVFISLIYAGMTVKTVCIFTGIKYKNFYLKKARFIKRISESHAPHKDLFIERFE